MSKTKELGDGNASPRVVEKACETCTCSLNRYNLFASDTATMEETVDVDTWCYLNCWSLSRTGRISLKYYLQNEYQREKVKIYGS